MPAPTKLIRCLLAVIVTSALTACASSPSSTFNNKAEKLGFSRTSLKTELFDLAMFSKPSARGADKVHIYIEGDGKPFLRNVYINSDPTSTTALILKLASQDNTNTIVLGRPCYHNVSARNCQDSKWWTSHRYSDQVVNSMAEAIRHLPNEDQNVTIIGFSGGGAIAALLASRLNNIERIVTINAPLNTDVWVKKHNYTPLFGSLNPINHLSGLDNTDHIHLVGAIDRNVNSESWKDDIERTDSGVIIEYENYSHHCCWEDIWHTLIPLLTSPN